VAKLSPIFENVVNRGSRFFWLFSVIDEELRTYGLVFVIRLMGQRGFAPADEVLLFQQKDPKPLTPRPASSDWTDANN